MKIIFILSIIVFSLITAYFSFAKSKKDQFYSDTFWLTPLGIFVWGDGMVLAPFWIVSAILWLILDLSNLWIARFYLLFLIFRSFYEVIYWLRHQAHGNTYSPPIGRNVAWLKPNDQQILYQVFHMCVVILGTFLLMFSFQK